MEKKTKNTLKIVENSENSSYEYDTSVNQKNNSLNMTPISIKRKLTTAVSCPISPTTNTLTPKTMYWD